VACVTVIVNGVPTTSIVNQPRTTSIVSGVVDRVTVSEIRTTVVDRVPTTRVIVAGQAGPAGPPGAPGPPGPPGPPGSGTGATLIILAEAVPLGAVLSIDPTGLGQLADDAAGLPSRQDFAGIALAAGLAPATISAATHRGVTAATLFAAPPAPASNGSIVYVGAGGVATLTAPTAPGSVVIEIGDLVGADGVSSTPGVFLRPRFVLLRP